MCVIDRRKTEIAGVGLYSFFVGDLKDEREREERESFTRYFFLSSLSLCHLTGIDASTW